MIKTWVNKYLVKPHELKPDMGAAIKVVAVVGHSGEDYAAYWGTTEMSDDDVARSGDKLSERAAMYLFPTFAAVLEYRE